MRSLERMLVRSSSVAKPPTERNALRIAFLILSIVKDSFLSSRFTIVIYALPIVYIFFRFISNHALGQHDVHVKKNSDCAELAVNSRKLFANSCTRKSQNNCVMAGLLTCSVMRRLPNQTGQWLKSVAI